MAEASGSGARLTRSASRATRWVNGGGSAVSGWAGCFSGSWCDSVASAGVSKSVTSSGAGATGDLAAAPAVGIRGAPGARLRPRPPRRPRRRGPGRLAGPALSDTDFGGSLSDIRESRCAATVRLEREFVRRDLVGRVAGAFSICLATMPDLKFRQFAVVAGVVLL